MRGSSRMLSTNSCGDREGVSARGGGSLAWGGGLRSHLELEAAQHEEEDAGEAGEADGQADQALEQQALPWRIIKLLGAGHGADPLNALIMGGEHSSV